MRMLWYLQQDPLVLRILKLLLILTDAQFDGNARATHGCLRVPQNDAKGPGTQALEAAMEAARKLVAVDGDGVRHALAKPVARRRAASPGASMNGGGHFQRTTRADYDMRVSRRTCEFSRDTVGSA
eukprot:scaffold1728_cov53-Phaeocystis_antarctica.AAC.1